MILTLPRNLTRILFACRNN